MLCFKTSKSKHQEICWVCSTVSASYFFQYRSECLGYSDIALSLPSTSSVKFFVLQAQAIPNLSSWKIAGLHIT